MSKVKVELLFNCLEGKAGEVVEIDEARAKSLGNDVKVLEKEVKEKNTKEVKKDIVETKAVHEGKEEVVA